MGVDSNQILSQEEIDKLLMDLSSGDFEEDKRKKDINNFFININNGKLIRFLDKNGTDTKRFLCQKGHFVNFNMAYKEPRLQAMLRPLYDILSS